MNLTNGSRGIVVKMRAVIQRVINTTIFCAGNVYHKRMVIQ